MRDAAAIEQLRRAIVVGERHPLASSPERLRMRRLEPDRDLEPAAEALRPGERPFADEPRVALDHDAPESRHERRDGLVVCRRNGALVEPARSVVELDDPGAASSSISPVRAASASSSTIWRGIAPAGVAPSSVPCQRSQNRQPNGHSAPTRKSVRQVATSPDGARSRSTSERGAANGSSRGRSRRRGTATDATGSARETERKVGAIVGLAMNEDLRELRFRDRAALESGAWGRPGTRDRAGAARRAARPPP